MTWICGWVCHFVTVNIVHSCTTYHSCVIPEPHHIALQLPKQNTSVCVWLLRGCSPDGLGQSLICLMAVIEEVIVPETVPTVPPSVMKHDTWRETTRRHI